MADQCSFKTKHKVPGYIGQKENIKDKTTNTKSAVFTSHLRLVAKHFMFKLPQAYDLSTHQIGIYFKDQISDPQKFMLGDGFSITL